VIKIELEKARKILKIKSGSPEKLLEICEAIWIYEGKKGEPHVLLTSGKHSDGYINLNAVLQFPNLSEILARKAIEKLRKEGIDLEKIDVVASSSYAAITFGQDIARQLKAIFVFTEKEGKKEGKKQKWTGRFEIPKGSTILQVEELITTLGTTRRVKKAILNANPTVHFLKRGAKKALVLTIVHRPEKIPITYSDYEVIALIEKEIHSWPPEECPLCQKGSKALKPKPNWEKFIKHR